MSKRKVHLALQKMGKGISLYAEGNQALDDAVSGLFGVGINDLVDGDVERQDMVFSMTEGISADADTIMAWGEEYLINSGHEKQAG